MNANKEKGYLVTDILTTWTTRAKAWGVNVFCAPEASLGKTGRGEVGRVASTVVAQILWAPGSHVGGLGLNIFYVSG